MLSAFQVRHYEIHKGKRVKPSQKECLKIITEGTEKVIKGLTPSESTRCQWYLKP